MKKFIGCWATFEYLDDLCDSIKELKKSGYSNLSTLSPCPRHEIDHCLEPAQSKVPYFTLFFGSIGVITAYTLTSWMSVDWPLPVSSKPLISLIPYTIIAFELMVLLGVFGTMFGIVFLIFKNTIKSSFPKGKKYKEYSRFTMDRFGLVVRGENMDNALKILKKFQAEEIHVEN